MTVKILRRMQSHAQRSQHCELVVVLCSLARGIVEVVQEPTPVTHGFFGAKEIIEVELLQIISSATARSRGSGVVIGEPVFHLRDLDSRFAKPTFVEDGARKIKVWPSIEGVTKPGQREDKDDQA